MIINKKFNNLKEAINYIYEEASKYALDGVKNNIGGPFGAGIIEHVNEEYVVININRNEVIDKKDPTLHAEINTIKEACKYKNSIFLENCILVSTSKSCPMCLAASIWARIPTIYYSLGYENATKSNFIDNSILEYMKGHNNIIKEIQLYDRCCNDLFNTWNELPNKTDY